MPVFEFSLRGDQLQEEEEELGFLARGNNAKSLDAPKVMAEVCDYRGCFGFLLCLGWRVGEHQFSSPNCPRSFQCGEHFPSSPVSQATIASTRKKRAIVKSISTLGYFLIFQVQFWLNGIITKKIFPSSLQGAWADIKRRDHQCDIFVIPRVEYRCIANYIQLNIFEDLRALDFKREKKFFGNSSDYWRYRHLYHEWAYCVKRSTV